MLLLQLQPDQHPFPSGPVAVWMKRSLLKYSIKYESQKWPLEVLRRGSGSVNTARSKTPTTGLIVKSAISHCDDDPRSLQGTIIVSNL